MTISTHDFPKKQYIGYILVKIAKFRKPHIGNNPMYDNPEIVFKVMTGLLISSIRCRRRKEGIAIKIKIIAGAIVHATSINWPSNKNRLVNLL